MFIITSSEFSILTSSVKITDYYPNTKINKFLELLRNKNVTSFAVVDNNSLYSMKKIDNMVKEYGPINAKNVLKKELGRTPTDDEIKDYVKTHGNYFNPVYGINLTIESMFLPKPTKIHIFAKNQAGMRKLVELSTKIKCDEDENPEASISLDFLNKVVNQEDIIAFTGGDASEINILFDKGFEKEAKYILQKYQDIFGKENLFLELSSTKTATAEYMWKISKKLKDEFGIKPVVTNEAFYLDKTHYKAHSYLTEMKDDSKLKFYHINHVNYNDEFYIKSEDEMRASLSDLSKKSTELLEEAFENTKNMENLCHAHPVEEKVDFSFFPTPGNVGVEKFVKDLAVQGFKERFPDSTYLKDGLTYNDYLERLRYEIKIIEEMGFLGYFAIVQDYIQFAKDDKVADHLENYFPSWKFNYDDIPDKFKKKDWKINIGPGRGSAAGSLVAYCLKITDRLDPIKNDLLFERFLNPERVSMPK